MSTPPRTSENARRLSSPEPFLALPRRGERAARRYNRDKVLHHVGWQTHLGGSVAAFSSPEFSRLAGARGEGSFCVRRDQGERVWAWDRALRAGARRRRRTVAGSDGSRRRG